MVTYGDCNTAEVDVAADTETTIASLTIPSGLGGTIIAIRLSGGAVATTVASYSGYIKLERGTRGGKFLFPVFSGNFDGDLGTSMNLAENIQVDIPIQANETVTIKGEFAGAIAGCHAGIVWVSDEA